MHAGCAVGKNGSFQCVRGVITNVLVVLEFFDLVLICVFVTLWADVNKKACCCHRKGWQRSSVKYEWCLIFCAESTLLTFLVCIQYSCVIIIRALVNINRSRLLKRLWWWSVCRKLDPARYYEKLCVLSLMVKNTNSLAPSKTPQPLMNSLHPPKSYVEDCRQHEKSFTSLTVTRIHNRDQCFEVPIILTAATYCVSRHGAID